MTDAAASITVDLTCTHCAYNLRAQPLNATCPECGKPIRDSLNPDLLRFTTPAWRKPVIDGIVWMLAATVWAVAMSLASILSLDILWIPLPKLSIHEIANLAMVGAVLIKVALMICAWLPRRIYRVIFTGAITVLVVYVWLLGGRNEELAEWLRYSLNFVGQPCVMVLGTWVFASGAASASRFAIRTAWVVFMLLTPMWLAGGMVRDAWRSTPNIALIVATILLYRYLVSIARRIPDRRLAVHTWIVCILAVVALTLSVFDLLLSPWIQKLPIPRLEEAFNYVTSIVSALYTIASVWEMGVLTWLLIRLRRLPALSPDECVTPGPALTEGSSP